MVGKVAAWCGNWDVENLYERLAREGVSTLATLTDTGFRAMRGAGRYGYEPLARSATRRRRDPSSVSENLGFRCAMTLEQ